MPINLTEITTAIKKTQNGKSLGPDGYPVFFKEILKAASPPIIRDV